MTDSVGSTEKVAPSCASTLSATDKEVGNLDCRPVVEMYDCVEMNSSYFLIKYRVQISRTFKN